MEYKLSDLFDLQMGKTPDRHIPEYWADGTEQWISIADLSKCDKYIEETAEAISEQAVNDSGIKIIPASTVIMSFKLSIGKVAITPKPMYSNEAIMAFIDKGVIPIEPTYLYFLLKAKDWDEGTNKAVMGKTLNKATLSQVKVHIHDLAEQRKIIRTLEKAESMVTTRRQQLTALDTLIKARFVEMFGTFPTNEKGWKSGTIRDLVTDVRYGSSRKAADGDSGQYPYLRMNNITYEGELDISDIKTIDIPDEELPKCTVRRGDVLFNRTNSKELVGKSCVYNRDEMMVLAGFVIRVRLNGRMLPEMLSAFLNTSFSKHMLLGLCKAAIGQANINAQEMQNIGIYIPPIECQKEFMDFKAQVDKSKAVVQAAHVIARNLHSRRQQKCRILNF